MVLHHLHAKDYLKAIGIGIATSLVTFWSVAYVVLFWGKLSFRRGAALAAVLLVVALAVFFPFIGWGFIGLAVGLFAALLWALSRWAFGTTHEAAVRYSAALRRG